MIANTYLEGSYSEVYPNISQDEEGMKKMFKNILAVINTQIVTET